MKKLLKKTGQITIGIALISALGLLAGSALTSWATASRANSILNAKIQVVERTEELHYLELKEDITEMKSDIKSILEILRG